MPLIGHVKQVLVDSRERIGCEGSCSPDALCWRPRPSLRLESIGHGKDSSGEIACSPTSCARVSPLDQQTSQFVVSEHSLDGRRNRLRVHRIEQQRGVARLLARAGNIRRCYRAVPCVRWRRRISTAVTFPTPSSLNALGSARSPASANFEEARFAERRIRMSRESAKRLACAVNQFRQHTCWARPAPREMPLHKKMQVLAEWDRIQRPECSYLELPVQVHLRSDGQLPLSGGLSFPTSAALPIH